MEQDDERERWHFDGRYYLVTMAGTPHSMDLELDDVAPAPGRGLVLLASYDDASGAMTLRTFTEDHLPLDLVEQFITEARRRLPPNA